MESLFGIASEKAEYAVQILVGDMKGWKLVSSFLVASVITVR